MNWYPHMILERTNVFATKLDTLDVSMCNHKTKLPKFFLSVVKIIRYISIILS